MSRLPRAAFVPPDFESDAYRDEPIAIAHRQVTTQPSLVATMVEALELTGPETVREVGTGYGYQIALLARLAHTVWSIDLWPDLIEAARRALAGQRITNVHLVVGDGTRGLPEEAPFDAIIGSAAFPAFPEPLSEQLAAGGRLVQPIGPGGFEEVTVFTKADSGLTPSRTLTATRFVPLYGEHGYGRDNAAAES